MNFAQMFFYHWKYSGIVKSMTTGFATESRKYVAILSITPEYLHSVFAELILVNFALPFTARILLVLSSWLSVSY